jgi:VWFA-related protein
MTRFGKTAAVAATCFVTSIAGALSAQQAPLTFRTAVDLVVVDAVAIGNDGAPVTTLGAGDFTIRVRDQVRRVVSAEYIAAIPETRAQTPAAANLARVPGPISNADAGPTRAFMFVVDVDEIRAGEGRSAMEAIASHVAKLHPRDLVGLVTLPDGSPRVELTTDHAQVVKAVGQVAGRSQRMRSSDMTPGEAQAISGGNTGVLADYWERTAGLTRGGASGFIGSCASPGRLVEPPITVPANCAETAERTLDLYRRHTRDVLSTLRALANTLAPVDGTKGLVLVSEGLYTDPQLRDDLRKFSADAERTRVSTYSLHLDGPLTDATTSGGSTITARRLDDLVGFDGMADLALSARGTALRVVADPMAALAQVERELSGYYLLAFERQADDKDGSHIRIDVSVNRPGIEVRARREFVPTKPVAPTTKPKKAPSKDERRRAVGEALRSAAPLREVGIELDAAILTPRGSSTDLRVMVTAEIATTAEVLDIGVELVNAAGAVVTDSLDAPAVTTKLEDGRRLFPAAFTVPPGQYTLRFAVVTDTGARGSLSHPLVVDPCGDRPLCFSDVLFGSLDNRAFRPTVRFERRDPIAVRFEVRGRNIDAFADTSVRVDVLRPDTLESVGSISGQLAATADALTRASTTLLDPKDLPDPAYILRIVLLKAGTPVGSATRRLRLQ